MARVSDADAVPLAESMTDGWKCTCCTVAVGSGVVANPTGTNTKTFTVTGAVNVNMVRITTVATLTIVTTGGGDASSSAVGAGPAPVIQQFGKPASGTCEAAAPVTLNWGGAGSGGWGESWAQWMNGGNGGAVCTRTLVYSNTLGGWTVV